MFTRARAGFMRCCCSIRKPSASEQRREERLQRERGEENAAALQTWHPIVGKWAIIIFIILHDPGSAERMGRECFQSFNLQIRAGPSSSLLLDSGTVLPVKVHTNPETGQILNLVFVWADGDYELNVDVPLVFKGEDVCPGLKKGGYLNTIRTSLQYLCPVEHIPPKIEVDLSNLDIGDKVLMSDVVVHPSLKLLSKNENMPVCKIMTRRSEIKDPTETL